MGGNRERSQDLPAASMGRLSLISIFAAPLRNLEEMRLCMLKRAASLRGNGRAVSTGGKTLPRSDRGREREEKKVGEVGRTGEREQRRREHTKTSMGAPVLAASTHKGDTCR